MSSDIIDILRYLRVGEVYTIDRAEFYDLSGLFLIDIHEREDIVYLSRAYDTLYLRKISYISVEVL